MCECDLEAAHQLNLLSVADVNFACGNQVPELKECNNICIAIRIEAPLCLCAREFLLCASVLSEQKAFLGKQLYNTRGCVIKLLP